MKSEDGIGYPDRRISGLDPVEACRDAPSFLAFVERAVARAVPKRWTAARLDASIWAVQSAALATPDSVDEYVVIAGTDPMGLVILHGDDGAGVGRLGPWDGEHIDITALHWVFSGDPEEALVEMIRAVITGYRPCTRAAGARTPGGPDAGLSHPYRLAGAREARDPAEFFRSVEIAARKAAPSGWRFAPLDAQNWVIRKDAPGSVLEDQYTVRANGAPMHVLIEYGNGDAGPFRAAPVHASYIDGGRMEPEQLAEAVEWVVQNRPCNTYGYS